MFGSAAPKGGWALLIMELRQVQVEAEKAIRRARSLADLRRMEKKYIGKQGEIAKIFNYLKKLPEQERRQVGEKANAIKKEIAGLLETKAAELKTGLGRTLLKEKIDITQPGRKIERGCLHPLSQVKQQAEEIFERMGFEVVEGPELETEWYNFDALNVPPDHPARDLQDTFWIKDKKGLLMRTQTSPVQVRYMKKHNPPLRIVVPGRVFRNEATDASHEAQFYQLEGLMVDEDISVSNFKAVIEHFLTSFFKTRVEIRLRPGYFPFVEPGFEIDAKRPGSDWLELMGAGMVHPNVFKAAGLNPKHWQGFAFGVGLGRLAMLKYKITDIRLFYQSDLRFLKQF